MNFFKTIGNFLGKLFTWHNAKAAAVTVERAAVTVADVTHGDVVGAAVEAASVADAAKSIHVLDTPAETAAKLKAALATESTASKLPPVALSTGVTPASPSTTPSTKS